MSSPRKADSYFTRHRLTKKNSQSTKNIYDDKIDKNQSLDEQKSNNTPISNKTGKNREQVEIALQQKLANNPKTKQVLQILSSKLIDQPKSQQELMYAQYKQKQNNYNKQMQDLDRQIDELIKQQEVQRKKIKQAQQSLESKKKQVKLATLRAEQMQEKLNKQKKVAIDQNNIEILQNKIKAINEENTIKIKVLMEQEQKAKAENQEIKSKLKDAEEQYRKYLQLDSGDYEAHMKRLVDEEKQLITQLSQLQAESKKIKRDIEKIQNMKPLSSDIHQKYLQLFEKMFIRKQIAKAEQIIALKEEEKKQNQQCARRRQWLKEKQMEINMREKRIAEKNQIIDQLTQQIKQKSTLLLRKYHDEGSKSPTKSPTKINKK